MLLLLVAMYLWDPIARDLLSRSLSSRLIVVHSLNPFWDFLRLVRSAHLTNVLFKQALVSVNYDAGYGHLRN